MVAGRKAVREVEEYKMEIRLLESSKDKMTAKFMLSKSSPSYANTLRRLIVNRVPTLAIEDVEIKKNNSALYDEMLAHRMGLMPLTTDLKSYVLKSKCKCKGEGCAQCEVKLTLKAKGPGLVKASELKSQDPKVKAVFGETTIAQLEKDQEIELVATAVLGTGREHAKWSPGHAWYTFKPTIKINEKSKHMEEFKEQYPKQIFKNGKIDKNLINTPELIDACDGVCDDIIKVEYDDTSFIFKVESWGQHSAKDTVVAAMNTFDELIDDFTTELKNI